MDKVIVNVDKTVVKITGIEVKGLNIQQLEKIINDKLKSMTRVIGVTGSSIDMDVYGIEEEDILREESGIIKAIAFAEGISINELSKLRSVKKIKTVNIDEIPEATFCKGERWNRL